MECAREVVPWRVEDKDREHFDGQLGISSGGQWYNLMWGVHREEENQKCEQGKEVVARGGEEDLYLNYHQNRVRKLPSERYGNQERLWMCWWYPLCMYYQNGKLIRYQWMMCGRAGPRGGGDKLGSWGSLGKNVDPEPSYFWSFTWQQVQGWRTGRWIMIGLWVRTVIEGGHWWRVVVDEGSTGEVKVVDI